MSVVNNLGFPTIPWALGHASKVYLVNTKTEQIERALRSEIEMVEGEIEGDILKHVSR